MTSKKRGTSTKTPVDTFAKGPARFLGGAVLGLACLVGVGSMVELAGAGDEEGPQRRTQRWTRGDRSVTLDLDGVEPAVVTRLARQLREDGYVLREPVVRDPAAPVVKGPRRGVDEAQHWTKGDRAVRLEMDDVAPGLATRLRRRLRDAGYTAVSRVTVESIGEEGGGANPDVGDDDAGDDDAGDDDAADDDPEDADEAPEDEAPEDEGLRRDLRELIRRGGRLPEGFVPEGAPDPELPSWWDHGSRAGRPGAPEAFDGAPQAASREVRSSLARVAGRILTRYLEVQDDPVHGPVFEAALAAVAATLQSARPGEDARRLGRALLPSVLEGLGDPEAAPAHAAMLEILSGPARGTPRPMQVGGARLVPAPGGMRVAGVAPDSTAARMSLAPGDVLLAVDGRPADQRAVATLRRAIEAAGQLTVRVRRRKGEVETLQIDFTRAPR